MKVLKKMTKFAMVFGLLAVLGACGKSDSAATGKTEIEVFSQKVEMKSTLQDIIDDFEKKNPKIDIKLTSVSDAGTVLKTRIAGGDVPDVINIFPQNADFKGWAADGKFLDLTGSDFLSHLKDGAAENYAIDNKIYSLPLNANEWGFFYNKTAFKKLGLKVPTTWAEFETLVAAIKAQGKTPFAASLTTDDSWSLNGYHQLAWATVTGGFDEAEKALIGSGTDGIKEGDANFEQVAKELSLVSGNAQKNANGASYSDAVAAFASGDALILPQGTWALPVIKEQDPDFDIGTFAYPGVEEGQEMTIGAADLAFSVSASASKAKQTAAKKFLAYLTQSEVMQKYYDVDGSPTSVKGVKTEGKFPETETLAKLAFTDKHLVWLQSEWTSEEDFWHMTVDYINSKDKTELAKDLNSFFNTMK